MEQFGQYGLLQGTGPGECQDTVFPVPVRKVVQIIFQRIEYRDAVGVDVPADVSVPQGNAFRLCIQCNAVQRALVDGEKRKRNEWRSRYSTSPTWVL